VTNDNQQQYETSLLTILVALCALAGTANTAQADNDVQYIERSWDADAKKVTSVSKLHLRESQNRRA
jgi:hypothetical protein